MTLRPNQDSFENEMGPRYWFQQDHSPKQARGNQDCGHPTPHMHSSFHRTFTVWSHLLSLGGRDCSHLTDETTEAAKLNPLPPAGKKPHSTELFLRAVFFVHHLDPHSFWSVRNGHHAGGVSGSMWTCVVELEDGWEGGGKKSRIKELAGGSGQEDWRMADWISERGWLSPGASEMTALGFQPRIPPLGHGCSSDELQGSCVAKQWLSCKNFAGNNIWPTPGLEGSPHAAVGYRGDSSDRQRCFCRVYVFLSTSRLSCCPRPSRLAEANVLHTA